jgi:WD40 repeat protein
MREVRREQGGTLPGALAFTRDGAVLAGLETSSRVRLLEVATGRALADLEGPERQWVRSLCFGPGGELVAARGDLSMQVWDIGLIRQQLRGMNLDWEGSAPASSKRTGHSPAPVRVQIDAREVRQFPGVQDGWVTRVAFTPDGQSALYIQSGRLMRLRLFSGETHRLDGAWKAGGWALSVSPDGRRALCSGEPPDTQLYYLEVSTGRVIHALRGHKGQLWAAAFTSDGTRASSGGLDGIRHWISNRGRRFRERPPGRIRFVAWRWLRTAG